MGEVRIEKEASTAWVAESVTGIDGTGKALSSTSRRALKGITIRAAAGNAADLLVGPSLAGAVVPIPPGQSEFFDVDDPSKVFVKAASGTLACTYHHGIG